MVQPGTLRSTDALVLVDVQNDFCPGGALPVPEGDAVVPVLNRWVAAAVSAGAPVVASRDWHPPGHVSFAGQGGPWPPHCVQHSPGSDYHPALTLPPRTHHVRKGADPASDQLSAFDGTGLGSWLRDRGVERVFVGGLALDVCVRATVLDALAEGLAVTLIPGGARPVDPGGAEAVMAELAAAGAQVGPGAGEGTT